MDNSEDRTMQERTAQYGPATFGHANLGLYWTGILQNHFGIELDHPIPAHVVLLMMAASKINRAATPTPGQEDDYIDGKNYLQLAEEALPSKIINMDVEVVFDSTDRKDNNEG